VASSLQLAAHASRDAFLRVQRLKQPSAEVHGSDVHAAIASQQSSARQFSQLPGPDVHTGESLLQCPSVHRPVTHWSGDMHASSPIDPDR
jgi:hypothetical protein